MIENARHGGQRVERKVERVSGNSRGGLRGQTGRPPVQLPDLEILKMVFALEHGLGELNGELNRKGCNL